MPNTIYVMNRYLLIAGILTFIVALTHVGIVIGGPDWYRFFGAGEMMAQQAEQGLLEPIVVTLSIAFILGIWTIYAFAGAGLLPYLPYQMGILKAICGIFLFRGIVGIPLVILVDHPYLNELHEKMTFMIISSLICLLFALLYFLGIRNMKNHKVGTSLENN